MSRIYVVRHGETDPNRENRLLGRLDPPLNANGETHAAHVADYLQTKGITHIYTSPLLRARRTAEIIGERSGVMPTIDDRLVEVDFGRLDGMRIPDAEKLPEYKARIDDRMNFRPPEGETYRELMARVEAFFKETVLEPEPAATAIVAHLGTIRMIAVLLGIMPEARAAHTYFGHETVLVADIHPDGTATASIEELSYT